MWRSLEEDRAGERVHESTCAQRRECERLPEAHCVRVLCIVHFTLAADMFSDGGHTNHFLAKHNCRIET